MRGFLNNYIIRVLVILLAAAFVLIFLSYFRIDDRLVITVDSFDLKKTKNVTVGRESDIAFDKVPEKYLTLNFRGDSMKVSVNRKADTLMYYKVNGENPNIHKLADTVKITVKGYGTPINVPFQHIKETFRKYSDPAFIDKVTGDKATEYIMLKHIIALQQDIDPGIKANVMSDELFQSFVHSKDGVYRLCILDKNTTCQGKGYAFDKVVPIIEGMFQVQFFRMAVNAYKKSEPSETDVVIDGVCYAAKPVIITTRWGAGHASIKVDQSKRSINVSYPRGITYVESLDSLKVRSSKTSSIMTVSQSGSAFPIYNNIYVPLFSEGVVPDFATVTFAKRRINMIDTCNDTTQLVHKSIFYPVQQKMDLSSGSDTVHIRTAVLNTRYWLSYIIFPTIIYLLMMLFATLVFRKRTYVTMVNKNRLDDHSGYFCFLLTIFYAYVLCKIFIAIKLSFTYPYFEKLSGIVVTSTSMMLLLMTTIAFVLNMDYLDQKVSQRRNFRRETGFDQIWTYFKEHPVLSAAIVLGLSYVLCLSSMVVMDAGNSAAMVESYLHSDRTFFSNPFGWVDNAGINDTHRSVCYTLFLIEALLLLYIAGRQVSSSSLADKLVNAVRNMSWYIKVRDFVMRMKGYYMTFRSRHEFLSTFLIAAALLIAAAGMPGNYATALITLILIFALSEMVITYEDLKNKWWVWLGKASLCVLLCVFAILPDQGYMVTWIGLFVAVLMFPIMTCRIEMLGAETRRHLKGVIVKYLSVFAIFAFVLIAMKPMLALAFDPDEVSWSRFSRRLGMFSDYDAARAAGYRYSEADMEFMQIMCHYMQEGGVTGDPLSNDDHFLHKSVSTGQSPVVLNDMSVQAAFFAPLGVTGHLIFILLLVVLAGTVMVFSLSREYSDEGSPSAFKMTRRRIIALAIWLGTSAYLYLSYMGIFPYTGRLIHGFGVDSVGEALEICVLFAFMSQIAIAAKEPTINN